MIQQGMRKNDKIDAVKRLVIYSGIHNDELQMNLE